MEDMPKKGKVIQKPRDSKRNRAPNFGMTIVEPYRRRVRSSLVHIDIPFDPVGKEYGPGPIDLDDDIVDPSKPFVALDVLGPTRPTNDYIYAFVGRL